jgi:hypothetical protein
VKRSLLFGTILASVVALAPAAATAGQGAGGCQLDGNATFDKPLTTASVTTGYSFAGTLSNCDGTYADKGGAVSAGRTITIGGVAYQPLDQPSLTGGCSNSTTSGTAFVDWGAGKYSAIKYTTSGAAALVTLTGTFQKSVVLSSVAVDPVTGQHTTLALSDLAYGGDSAGGPLAFQPADPTACAGAGVATAGIHGAIAHGNDS